jgi:heat shock protein HtpX
VEHLAGSRLDYTHPPTAYRIEVIESLPDATPAFVFDAERRSRVDAELERFRAPLGREIVEDYEIAVGA